MSPQLEESEFTCAAAVKARKSMEVEIEDLHLQIDDLSKAKAAVSDSGVRRAVLGTCPGGRPLPRASGMSLHPLGLFLGSPCCMPGWVPPPQGLGQV